MDTDLQSPSKIASKVMNHTIESFLLQIGELKSADGDPSVNKNLFSDIMLQLDSLLNDVETPLTEQVINLSTRTLTTHQLSVLSKGLD